MKKAKDPDCDQNAIRRQLEMLRMLRRDCKITVQQLRKRLDDCGYKITDRTVQRDLRDLSTMFPIISDERSKPHGWQWKPDAPLCNLGGLTLPEAIAFQMLARFGKSYLPLTIAETLQPYFREADEQLNQSLGSTVARNWINKIRSVAPMQPLLPPTIPGNIQQDVHEALMKNCCLKIRYRSAEANASIIHPLGLVEHGKNFYLAVRYDDFTDIRLLVLHRIYSTEVLDQPVCAPEGFDLDKYIAAGGMGFGELGEGISLKLRMFNGSGAHLRETPLGRDQIIEDLGTGEMIITATVNLTERLRWWLLGFGPNVEVLEPIYLRDELREKLENAVARYSPTESRLI